MITFMLRHPIRFFAILSYLFAGIAVRNIWLLSEMEDPSPTVTNDGLVNLAFSASYWMANWWFVAVAALIGMTLKVLSYRLDA